MKQESSLANEHGLTMIEMVVAVALIGIVTFAVQSVVLNMISEGSNLKQRTKLEKIVRSMLYQISVDTRNVPAIIRDARFDDSGFVPFDDKAISERKCFDAEGAPSPLEETNNCKYDVSYYRLQMTDNKFRSGSDLGSLPLYRLYVRVKYLESSSPKEFYISQFMTAILAQ